MKTIKTAQAIFEWHGKLVETIGIINDKAIIFKIIREEDKDRCSHCNVVINKEFVEVEGSPNFQEASESVPTLEDK